VVMTSFEGFDYPFAVNVTSSAASRARNPWQECHFRFCKRWLELLRRLFRTRLALVMRLRPAWKRSGEAQLPHAEEVTPAKAERELLADPLSVLGWRAPRCSNSAVSRRGFCLLLLHSGGYPIGKGGGRRVRRNVVAPPSDSLDSRA
jgi:hypothetical protein